MSRQPPSPLMNERAQHLLRVLIDRYIREGEPVGSRTLARDSRLDLSPATVRNVMSDLEEMGFVAAPHTSAGRIPTVQGYRLFVDSLLNIQPLDSVQVEQLRQELWAEETDSGRLIETASNLLSDITRMAGVVTLPRREHVALRRIDFLPLSQNRILVILVINEKEVQNRIIQTERTFSASELETIANFLNAHFAGTDIHAVRTHLIDEMQQTRQDMNDLMMSVVSVAEKVFSGEDSDEEDYVLAGQTNLMQFRELSDVEKLRELFEAFNRKRDILHLLDKCICANGVQLFIGEESGYQVLDECSLVTAPYSVEGEVIGVLGVIGPTRMAYDRIIPIVDATARLLGAALNSRD
ncbi:MAG TPA: heat-inducible transcriptional repressor HrcA [Thiohalobacter sp.]|nr:heat-inducible transcriptional repressor HrcA [Thiohalobacter sp.]